MMTEKMIKISIDEAKQLIELALRKYGYKQTEINKIIPVIMYGALKNSSQGMAKLFSWHIEKNKLATEPIFTKKSDSIGRFDACRNNGMYVCSLALEKLSEMVEKTGVVAIGVYNFNSSSGSLGYFTDQLAKKGLVGIMLASADPIGGIAPKGRKIGVFGTNPLSIAVPYKKTAIVLDMSMAKYTFGDLIAAEINGRELEPGFAFDKNGQETIDPSEAKDGTVTAFDGSYKGLGLALMIQILAGALVGSVYEQNDIQCDYGVLIIAIDPRKLGGKEFIDKQIEKIVVAYKNNEAIFLPGEKGQALTAKNQKDNSIIIEDSLMAKIKNFLEAE